MRPCANLGDYWEVLGLGGTINAPVNVDKARIRGVEVAGRLKIVDGVTLRANYTYTDSEQRSGPEKGQPLTNTAKHMANATINWQITEGLSTQLTAEHRSSRYRGLGVDGSHLYYKGYEVLHLGAQYRLTDFLTLSVRVNNLLDRDFTSYQHTFVANGDGSYTPTYMDDYNNKDKARSYWVSISARF